jgi:23S rRNA (cytosine1962-C5)-methyltransferase
MSADWFSQLPPINAKRLAVKVTPDALRQIRGGSPWVYDGSIVSASHEGAAGDLAVVFDNDRKFAAIGLWDPASPIRLKVLHKGSPQTIDDAWWRHHIGNALDRRSGLVADPDTTGYRVIHGENDYMPGLVADRYHDTIVVKVYTPAWFPHLQMVIDSLVAVTGAARVVLRFSRNVLSGFPSPGSFGLTDGAVIVGTTPTSAIRFKERGLVLEADVLRGQKTGHFLDQRDNRQLVRGMAEGLDVLDVFSSTGGFSLAAAAGGAKSVTMVDLSAPAIDAARRNFEHNSGLREVRECRVSTRVGDAFEVLAQLRADPLVDGYDIVVVDPPSFAQNQASVARALKAYRKLTESALGVLKPGGMLVQCSCSSRVTPDDFFDTVHEAAKHAGRYLKVQRRTGHAIDHPIGFEQGGYLKAIFARA